MSRPAAGSPGIWGPFGAAAALVAADQLTKAWIVSALAPGERVPVVPGWFQLHFIVNRGGLFGLLRDLPDLWRTVLFSGIPLAACVGLTYFLLRAPRYQPLLRAGLACILGGAAGNLVDRLRLGHVIDFLDVFWRDHHWPAFNVADSAICVGVGLILLDALLGGSAQAASTGAAEEP
ncbi:MAG: signal peptidase II [Acidobacteriota bacterium]|jgi:signal peptidase II